MKVACVQQMAQGVTEYESVEQNLMALIDEAAGGGADLIVLPEMAYPAYFLYIDRDANERALAGTAVFLQKVSDRAKRHGVYIAVGYAVCRDGKIYNAADLYDDEGQLAHSCDKSNMWHMDKVWTTPGEDFRAFDTKFGRMGMLVCADGRVPEITRILALQGAKAIIDPVNLVASASQPKDLMNQQYAFLLPTRAMENKVWFFVANKAGLEAKTVGYLGRSMVIDPEGSIVAEASPDKQEIVYCDVDLDREPGEPDARKPALYRDLVRENEALPAYKALTSSVENIAECEIYVSTLQFEADSEEEYLDKARFYISACGMLDTKLIFFPTLLPGLDMDEVRNALQQVLPDRMVAVLPGVRGGIKQACVFGKSGRSGEFFKTHGGQSQDITGYQVVETPYGRVAVVFDRELYIPEIARVYTLLGVDLLLWADCEARPMNTKLLRTRAAENKIFVARSSCVVPGESVCIANPDGAVIGAAFTGTEQAASGLMFLPLSRAKSVVPGTNIITGRFGRAYNYLVK